MKTFWQYMVIGSAALVPLMAGAQEGEPVDAGEIWKNRGNCTPPKCGWNDLIYLIEDVVGFLVLLAIPISAIVFTVAGFKVLTAGDNANARNEAKSMAAKVAVGLAIMLAAGLIVKAITSALLKQEFVFV